MSDILSNKVSVYPSARRAAADSTYRESRLLSEGAIIDTNNHILDNESYVINNAGIISTDAQMEFIIYGYYFKIASVLDILSTIDPVTLVEGANIYAKIEVVNTGGIKELIGQDSVDPLTNISLYNGILFTTEEPDPSQSENIVKYLKILTIKDGVYEVPKDSIEKYDITKMNGIIDCGVIL